MGKRADILVLVQVFFWMSSPDQADNLALVQAVLIVFTRRSTCHQGSFWSLACSCRQPQTLLSWRGGPPLGSGQDCARCKKSHLIKKLNLSIDSQSAILSIVKILKNCSTVHVQISTNHLIQQKVTLTRSWTERLLAACFHTRFERSSERTAACEKNIT